MIGMGTEGKFMEGLELAEKGRLVESLRIFQDIGGEGSYDYCAVVNFGVLCLQQGRLGEARRAFAKAIKLDCYEYLAYYNMFLLGCHAIGMQKRRGNQNKEDQNEARRQILNNLYQTLSCLYAELADCEADPKLCSKSLLYSEQNSSAYLNRAILYQHENKPTLAENDYSSAIYYDPENPTFYMKRAEFYWKHNKIEDSNADIRMWVEKRAQKGGQGKVLGCREIGDEEVRGFQGVIEERCVELYGLLERIRDANQRREDNWVFRIPTSPRTVERMDQFSKAVKEKQKEIKENVIAEMEKEDSDLLLDDTPIQSLINGKPNQHAEESKEEQKAEDAYIDESSKNISQQIQKLEKEIRLERGKLSEEPSQSQSQSREKQVSAEVTFLTDQIEKTSKQIETIKKTEQVSQQISASSAQSHHSQKFLSVDQLKTHTKILLEIVSAQYFDSSNKQQSKVYLTYGKQKAQTSYSKTNFWRQKIQFNLQHALHKDFKSALESSSQLEEPYQLKNSQAEIKLQLEMKSKSVWNSKKIIGRSSINVQAVGQNKCILSNEKEKTGIVYYKIKLI